MPDFSWLMIFLLGFLGGVHCVGMCGGLTAAFVLQLPPGVSRLGLLCLLNAGRITGYVAVGFLLGAAGGAGTLADPGNTVRITLWCMAQTVLLLLGLYLMGASSGLLRLEKIGVPLWNKISPFFNRLLPLKNARSAFVLGLLWGWLPCGLVYAASLYALSTGDARRGAAVMALFGLGTLPNLLAMGFFAASLQSFFRHRAVRIVAGLIIIAWVLWSALRYLPGVLET